MKPGDWVVLRDSTSLLDGNPLTGRVEWTDGKLVRVRFMTGHRWTAHPDVFAPYGPPTGK